jgi:hypothetical protein
MPWLHRVIYWICNVRPKIGRQHFRDPEKIKLFHGDLRKAMHRKFILAFDATGLVETEGSEHSNTDLPQIDCE